MTNPFLKTVTIILFVCLIGIFVGYKAGFWGVVNGSIQLSPNGSALNGSGRDSTEFDTLEVDEKMTIMPSSKSMSMGFEDEFFTTPDSANIEARDSANALNKDSVNKKKENKGNKKEVIMPSSKSGPMFN